MKLYNTLSRSVEEFIPQNPPAVTMYSCGPTVYDYQHIGHMRRYVGDDILKRVLKLNGYKVQHVMNITDVGHLVSDADEGEDKMEKGAKKFGMSVWDIAKKFEKQFFDSTELLNIERPDRVMHATDYIKEQIAFIEVLEVKGFTYKTSDGIYFDTSKFANYNKLSHQSLENIKAGVRVEMGEKKHGSDFALWKFSYLGGFTFQESIRPPGRWPFKVDIKKRQMEWDSPWGVGFPGWHIECSTMAIKGLETETLDIHTGGIDHINIHHTNEIAQSEAATGKEFVKYWVHHNFLLVENEKMSKSIGNIYTVQDVINKRYESMALRYLYLQTHYRQEMNFTWDALDAATSALTRIKAELSNFQKPKGSVSEFDNKFKEAVSDDLNTPQALAILWELLKSDAPSKEKAGSVVFMDEVLGLDLEKCIGKPLKIEKIVVADDVQRMVDERNKLRKHKHFGRADQMRNRIKKTGYEILDNKDGTTTIVKS